jgi:hypothetical protein
MYCPRCGQQQISEEMRFCSRCGLPMSGLAEWIASGGVPAARGAETQALRSPRRKRRRRGSKLMFFSLVLFPVFLIISLMADEGAPMVVPVFLLFVSLTMMMYSRFFGEETSSTKDPVQQSILGGKSAAGALPPPSNIPVSGFTGRPVRTAELAQPPSVTENTTRLLDKE